MKKQTGFVLGFILPIAALGGESILATQLRDLRNSLPVNDPSRSQLTLRLADVLFNDALKDRTDLDSKGVPSTDSLKRTQREALALYETSLKGEEGNRVPAVGEGKMKIFFQEARLYQDLGDMASAKKLFTQVESGSTLTALKRESVLRLAEMQEQEDPHSKDVETEYKKTLDLCQGSDLCSYAHYRLGWYYRNQGDSAQDLAKAISEMKLALYDSKGNVREESLRDLIVFTAVNGSDGLNELVDFDALSQKLSRPLILDQLTDAYFGAGNKKAGIRFLELIHSRKPQLAYGIRLLEEQYGLRNWAMVDSTLAQLSTPALLAQKSGMTELATSESEKILKRLSIQLDQERKQDARQSSIFHGVVDLYLALYPQSSERMKMIEGWLVAETDYATKQAKVSAWVSSADLKLTVSEQIHLHELAVSYAQKEKDLPMVITQADELIRLTNGKREDRYLKAHALYEKKDYATALPLFQGLAQVEGSGEPDTYAIQSQNLALDIFNQQKRYQELQAQAESWTNNPALLKFASLKKELSEMTAVHDQAEFQYFAGLGETPQALDQFLRYCLASKFTPQSCENAKVLSVRQQNQTALIQVLRALGKKDELASELEAAGFFGEAADMANPLGAGKTVHEQLKAALLYELAGNETKKNAVLAAALKNPALRKTMGQDEDSVLAMVQGTPLFTASLLSLPWNPKNKMKIVDALVVSNQANASIEKMVLASNESTGPGWDKLVVSSFEQLWKKEHSINFYGKNSKRQFDARMAVMKQLAAFVEKKLNGADLVTRLILLNGMNRAYQGLSMAILDSPIPAELTPEQSQSLKESLSQLATPFAERAGHFEEMFNEQMKKGADQTQVVAFAKGLQAEKDMSFSVPDLTPKSKTVAQVGIQTEGIATEALHKNPNDRVALEQLKNYFEGRGQVRLSAYYQGRLMTLSHEGVKTP